MPVTLISDRIIGGYGMRAALSPHAVKIKDCGVNVELGLPSIHESPLRWPPPHSTYFAIIGRVSREKGSGATKRKREHFLGLGVATT
jgi:hypothetical protein